MQALRPCAARPRRNAALQRTPTVGRNRLLAEPHEVAHTASTRVLHLPPSDSRAVHIATVLRAKPGQRLRVGIVNGPLASAELSQHSDGSFLLSWAASDETPPLPPAAVDLLLALPRPKVLRRLWAPLAQLGVGAVYLTPASRVEEAYSRLDVATVRSELVRGLEQAGDTTLPSVFLSRRFPHVVDAARGRRPWEGAAFGAWLLGGPPVHPPACLLLAHPGGGGSVSAAVAAQGRGRVLLAVGPEGGWSEHELAVLQGAGSACVSLGPRPLCTTTACIALLSVVKEALGRW